MNNRQQNEKQYRELILNNKGLFREGISPSPSSRLNTVVSLSVFFMYSKDIFIIHQMADSKYFFSISALVPL